MSATFATFQTISPRQRFADWIFPEGRERRAQLERAANTDQLTGLANARSLACALPTAEAAANTSVILFDANNFGMVNKRLGHAAGDELLGELAAALRIVARCYGVGGRVFRLGGDEFVVLAPAPWATKLRDRAEQHFGERHFASDAGDFTVSLSGTVAATLAAADSVLQQRKQQAKEAKLNELPNSLVPAGMQASERVTP